MTKATYDAVGDRFRSLWGKEAGWAHSVLFTADLRAFSERLTTKVEVKKVKVEGETSILADTLLETHSRVKREADSADGETLDGVTVVVTKSTKKRRKV